MRIFQYIKMILFSTVIVLTISGCNKKSESPQIIEGTLSLDVQVMHHSWNVPNIPLYLKKNATEFPGNDTSIYELKTYADSDGKALFAKLYPGKYYLYTKGYDYYFGADVTGSTAINLTNSSAANEPVHVTLMVSE